MKILTVDELIETNPIVKKTAEILAEKMPGWKLKFFYTPGKQNHESWAVERGGELKNVHINLESRTVDFQ